MASWQQKLGGARRLFSGAAGLDDEAWQAFVTKLAAYLEPRRRPVKVQRSGVSTARADGPMVNLEVHALAARCARAPRGAWTTLVSEHLAAILAPPDLKAQFDYRNFDQAKDRLKMRLCPPAELEARGELPVVRLDVAPGLAAVLAYDLPAGACDVPPEDFLGWGNPEASLFAKGLANLRRVQDVELVPRDLPSGATMQMLRSDSPFVSAQLLELERLLDGPSSYGTLACVPKTDLLLFHRIQDARVRQAAQELGKLAAMLHQRGPSPLSPHLYWVRKGSLTHLPMEVSSHGVTFKPPAGFTVRVLEPLGA
jgi:hypothetical protein